MKYTVVILSLLIVVIVCILFRYWQQNNRYENAIQNVVYQFQLDSLIGKMKDFEKRENITNSHIEQNASNVNGKPSVSIKYNSGKLSGDQLKRFKDTLQEVKYEVFIINNKMFGLNISTKWIDNSGVYVVDISVPRE